MCDVGYGINNGNCLKCLDNCQYCDESNSCWICKPGFQLSKDNS